MPALICYNYDALSEFSGLKNRYRHKKITSLNSSHIHYYITGTIAVAAGSMERIASLYEITL